MFQSVGIRRKKETTSHMSYYMEWIKRSIDSWQSTCSHSTQKHCVICLIDWHNGIRQCRPRKVTHLVIINSILQFVRPLTIMLTNNWSMVTIIIRWMKKRDERWGQKNEWLCRQTNELDIHDELKYDKDSHQK